MALTGGGGRPGGSPECRICYEPFDRRARRPQLLPCRHRVCAGCLRRLAGGGVGPPPPPPPLRCPFCRREAPLPPARDVSRLPDDGRLLALLSSPELLLGPGEPRAAAAAADCLVVTLLEVPAGLEAPEGRAGLLDMMRLYRPPSPAALPCGAAPWATCGRPCGSSCPALPRCLAGLCCLLYFSSLPLGIYLLLAQRLGLGLGLVLVSLVPSTLILCALYSLCQCLCHQGLELPLEARPVDRGSAGRRRL